MFRVYGPYETDYHVESSEIGEALTDWDLIGKEREGEDMMHGCTELYSGCVDRR